MTNMPPGAAQRHPVLELLARYRAVFGAAWQMRHELAGPRRLADEAAFLPAALALQETPVHPAPRRAIWMILALFTLALAWACVGQIDIVAAAPGRIVVSDGTKLVQPLEAGIVRAIHVKDGDHVQAGQVLIELDPTTALADSESVAAQVAAARADLQRGQALLAALDAPSGPGSQPALPDPQTRAEWADIAAKLTRLDAELARRQAEAATTRELLAKLDTTLPLARQRETDVQALAAQGFVATHAGQDRTRERIELERDLATQRARVNEGEAILAETRQTRQALLAETRRALNDRLTKATLELAQLQQQSAKTAHRERIMQLTSPVTGTVEQLAIRSTGGVVTPAQALLVVVPDDAEITAEVSIENKDIGFVRVGQTAAVKLEAFSFTRYGTVPAVVARVSSDAVVDEKRGPVFAATLRFERASIALEGVAVRLSPGLNVTGEIRTGDRRVVEYLLSPFQRTVGDGLRER
ncbi:MAG: HlyD family type I secretion periplasmic adaptor subunit [Rubrivivax sp.]